MSNQSESNHHINPRYRAYGRARLDIAQRARTRQDWDRLWKRSQYSYPFVWGQHWKQCVEYRVDDFAAEIGFLIDILGLPVNAFNPEFAMFTGLDREFYFSVTPAPPGMDSTPPDAIRIQFMVDDIFATTEELQRRGVVFDAEPQAVTEGSLQWIAAFRTPHGICMELWGMVEPVEEDPALRSAVEPPLDTRLPIAQFLDETEDDPDEEQIDELEEEPSEDSDLVEEEIEAPIQPAMKFSEPEPVRNQQPGRNTAPTNKPPRLFKNSQEMLAHLQGKGASISPVFRPAPKPAPSKPQPEEDQSSSSAEEEGPSPEDHPYKPIPFNGE